MVSEGGSISGRFLDGVWMVYGWKVLHESIKQHCGPANLESFRIKKERWGKCLCLLLKGFPYPFNFIFLVLCFGVF